MKFHGPPPSLFDNRRPVDRRFFVPRSSSSAQPGMPRLCPVHCRKIAGELLVTTETPLSMPARRSRSEAGTAAGEGASKQWDLENQQCAVTWV